MHRDHPWEYRRGPFQRDTFLLRRSGKINDEEFNDEESADVIFEVGSGITNGPGTSKKSKATTTFHAHRFVLLGASTLAEMCKPLTTTSV